MTKKLKNLSLSLTCVRQLPRQREPSVYGWQIKSAAVYKASCLVQIFAFADAEFRPA